ncbi:MAG: hypothetical protein Q4E24_16085 [bacterium]|nr:hypothetical protein [bacterium]
MLALESERRCEMKEYVIYPVNESICEDCGHCNLGDHYIDEDLNVEVYSLYCEIGSEDECRALEEEKEGE